MIWRGQFYFSIIRTINLVCVDILLSNIHHGPFRPPPPKKKNYEKVNYSIFFMKNDEKQCRYLFLKKYILIKNVIGYFYLRLSGSATITLAVSWCMTWTVTILRASAATCHSLCWGPSSANWSHKDTNPFHSERSHVQFLLFRTRFC